jgi:glyoxalase family protein
MQLTGIHHLTAISADAPNNKKFYTEVLGLRLVKKTVNQDEVSAYHLFYADGQGSPGSDITFFDFKAPPEERGNNSVSVVGLRVAAGKNNLLWWHNRLTDAGVKVSEVTQRDGRMTLDFMDPEGLRLALVDDGGKGEAHPWGKSPVPAERQIRGLGPIVMTVPDLKTTHVVLTQLMEMRHVRDYPYPGLPRDRIYVYEMGEGGPAAELHVALRPDLPKAKQGAGGVPLVQVAVFPRAQRRAVRDRDRRAGLCGRRADRCAWRQARAAAVPGRAPCRDRGRVEAARLTPRRLSSRCRRLR